MSLLDFLRMLFSGNRKPPVDPPSAMTGGLMGLLNNERSKHGLTLLRIDPQLTVLAQSWASRMATKKLLGHGDFIGRIRSVFPDRAAGEVIAAGQTTPEQAVARWMSSPPHRSEILNPAFRAIGVGRSESDTGIVYWCADFTS